MNFRRLATGVGILAICGVALYRSGSAAPASKDAQTDSVAARYARAQLRLAELTLQKAQAMNQKVAGTLVGSMVSQLADEVEFARLQVRSTGQTGEVDPLQACMQRAELGLRLSEARLRRATEANQRVPGTVQPLDLERLRLGVEVAQLRIESGRSIADASPNAKLQWQIEMLSEEMSSLRQKTYLLGQNRYQF